MRAERLPPQPRVGVKRGASAQQEPWVKAWRKQAATKQKQGPRRVVRYRCERVWREDHPVGAPGEGSRKPRCEASAVVGSFKTFEVHERVGKLGTGDPGSHTEGSAQKIPKVGVGGRLLGTNQARHKMSNL